MTWLLDGNVLVALALTTHVFHDRAQRWFAALTDPFATCAVTEGTLLRVHMRFALDTSAAAAWEVLSAIHAMPEHRFWADGYSYCEVSPSLLTSPVQVTDAWLAHLARTHHAKLATLDSALVTLHPDIAVLVPE